MIVGGGHNGLVATAYLAHAGQSVLVLERNDWLGGATASQRVFPDYDAYLSRYACLVSLLPPVILGELGIRFETRRRSVASFTAYQRDGAACGLVISNVDGARSKASMRELTGGCGSSALRGGAVSGVPGFLVARKIFEEDRVLVPG